MLSMVVLAIALLTLASFGDRAAAIEAPDDTGATILVEAPPVEPSSDAAAANTTTSPPPNTRPPISANDFIPDDRDLTSCIGVLERPGCGSKSRGGWRQTLVFVAMFVGLVAVFGNVARGVRKRNR
jgi:hypothetical protein